MAEMTLIVDIIIMARTLASIIVIIMADDYDYGWDTFQPNIVNMAKMILDIYEKTKVQTVICTWNCKIAIFFSKSLVNTKIVEKFLSTISLVLQATC